MLVSVNTYTTHKNQSSTKYKTHTRTDKKSKYFRPVRGCKHGHHRRSQQVQAAFNLGTMVSQMFNERSVQSYSREGAEVVIKNLSYWPPGSPRPLLQNINMRIPKNQVTIVYGKSGSGKSSLLSVISGLAQHTGGAVEVMDPRDEIVITTLKGTNQALRQKLCGMVFQFPERHFVGLTIYDELTYNAPRMEWYSDQYQSYRRDLIDVLKIIGMDKFPLNMSPEKLSDGYQRRLALAIQLIRRPSILLLDEPLAGLDWKARTDFVNFLSSLRSQCTILIVTHDLREFQQLTDNAYRMKSGGTIVKSKWPLPSYKDFLQEMESPT